MASGSGSFSKKGGSRNAKGYGGIIRGLCRAPLRDYIGVILRNSYLKLEWLKSRRYINDSTALQGEIYITPCYSIVVSMLFSILPI